MEKNYLNYYLNTECDKYAGLVTKILREKGYQIVLFTNRSKTCKDGIVGVFYRSLLKHWLSNNNIEYDEIIYCNPETSAKEKYLKCREQKIEMMIEDQKMSSYLLSDICKVILINRPYNIGVKLPNIVRINGFEAILKGIEELNKRKVKGNEKKH